MNTEIPAIKSFLLDKHGIDLSKFEEAFIQKTIHQRITDNNLLLPAEYTSLLFSNEKEIENLKNILYIDYSEFFRETIAFAYLEQILLPFIVKNKKSHKEHEIRVWSAACAKGEEALSAAILIDEYLKKNNSKMDYRIFATDVQLKAKKILMQGVFHRSALNKISIARLETYFTKDRDQLTINKDLISHLDFSHFDLLNDQAMSPSASIFGNFDIIFCSNILFYYKPTQRKQILKKIALNIAENGYIITSESEREILREFKFREVFANSGIFQRI